MQHLKVFLFFNLVYCSIHFTVTLQPFLNTPFLSNKPPRPPFCPSFLVMVSTELISLPLFNVVSFDKTISFQSGGEGVLQNNFLSVWGRGGVTKQFPLSLGERGCYKTISFQSGGEGVLQKNLTRIVGDSPLRHLCILTSSLTMSLRLPFSHRTGSDLKPSEIWSYMVTHCNL